MSSIPVVVKHQGKKHDLELDPSTTGETFKIQLFSLTGVEPDRQKILIKGGQLKDDTELSKIGAKPGHVFMMMGTPAGDGPAPELSKPKEKIKFMEDMTEAEAAQSEGATPAGLQNLGNTCYMNSTIQVLRAVPELQDQLFKYKESKSSSRGVDLSQYGLTDTSSSIDLTGSLRDLFRQMSQTQEGFPPLMFLHALQTVNPQFAERSQSGHGYAQQDAEEAWTTIMSQLRTKLRKTGESSSAQSASTNPQAPIEPFVDQYMSGRMLSTRKLTDAGASEGLEEPVISEDKFSKVDCHISITTNHLHDGIMSGLSEKITKNSVKLERDAEYTVESRVSRLPQYLTVHLIRFFWRRDINKKTKIMRKITFPAELDATEFCDDALRKRLVPVRDKVREVRKEEVDMERARKRQKLAHQQDQDRAADGLKDKGPADGKKSAAKKENDSTKGNEKGAGDETVYKTDAEYEAERAASLHAAKKQLYSLIDPELMKDEGSNRSGLYDLIGVVTHQGASADSGHYTAYVKKSAAKKATNISKDKDKEKEDDDGKWWWFNDDKVSLVDAEKIEALAGGGEAHSALILLYRAIELPTSEEVRD